MIVICVHSSGVLRVIARVAVLPALLAGAVGCAGAQPGGDGVRVVVGFYPLQYVVEQIGGDRVTVTNLAQPGAEPHDLELSPQQMAAVADADLVVYLSGFQPELDEAVELEARDEALEVSTIVPLIEGGATHAHDELTGEHAAEPAGDGGGDPHFWLDPTRLSTVTTAVSERLAAVDPAGAAAYATAATSLAGRLSDLDRTYAHRLAACQRREIVVSHAAFGYLAERYDLEQIGITGLSPDVEPTPQRLAEVTAAARHHGATTIFFETLVSPRVAEAIAAEVGAATAVLDPLEGLPAGSTGDYVSVMRTNLDALTTALDCA
jgi:zinc transport system substrate-binding protein